MQKPFTRFFSCCSARGSAWTLDLLTTCLVSFKNSLVSRFLFFPLVFDLLSRRAKYGCFQRMNINYVGTAPFHFNVKGCAWGEKAIVGREALLPVPSGSAVGLHLQRDVNWCKLLQSPGHRKVHYLASLVDSSLLRDFSKVLSDCLFWIHFRRGALVFLKKWRVLSSSPNSRIKTGSVLKQSGACCWWFRSRSFPYHLAAWSLWVPLSLPCASSSSTGGHSAVLICSSAEDTAVRYWG